MNTLEQFANWKTLLLFFALTALFSFFIFPYHQEKINQLAGEKLGSLDARKNHTFVDNQPDRTKQQGVAS